MKTPGESGTCPPHDFDLLRQCRKCGLGSVRPQRDGPSPTDAEFDAAIDLAYRRLHAFRQWQGDDNFAHPGTLIADALAGLLTLCGRGTDRG